MKNKLYESSWVEFVGEDTKAAAVPRNGDGDGGGEWEAEEVDEAEETEEVDEDCEEGVDDDDEEESNSIPVLISFSFPCQKALWVFRWSIKLEAYTK